jgi:protein O-GlcNAc transferase
VSSELTFQQAVERHRAGDLTTAQLLYRRVLELDARHDRACFLLGSLLHEAGHAAEGTALMERAVALAPGVPTYRAALSEANRLAQLRKAATKPQAPAVKRLSPTAERAFRLALEHHKAGRIKDAEAHYRKLLKIEPKHAEALFWFGSLALETDRVSFAIDMLSRACGLEPNVAAYQSNLGEALARAGRSEPSIAAFERALGLEPASAERHFNLALALRAGKQRPRALESFAVACQISPHNAQFQLELARELQDSGQTQRAVEHFRASLRESPNPQVSLELASALRVLGTCLSDAQRLDDAVASFEHALSLEPSLPGVRGDLALALLGNGRVEEAVSAWEQAIAQDPNDVIADSNRLFALAFHPGFDDPAIAAAARQWAARHEAPLAAHVRAHDCQRSPDKKLRVGYVGSVFREHAVGMFLVPLVEQRVRGNYELYCYSNVTRPDAITTRLQRSADVWREVAQLSDSELAELIRADGIDVLLDLNMHMSTPRLRTFASRPAPVQLCWGAYPGTTGVTQMDYRLTDRHLDPPGAPLPYTEASIVLPDSFWCYDSLTHQPEVSPLPALTRGQVCFGNLNGVWKLNRQTAVLWSKVLRAVEGSTLVLLSAGWMVGPRTGVAEAERRVAGLFEQEGIAAERVRFLPRAPRLEYFDYYRSIDVCLDSLPYGGHTTSLDALWMGVPTVSLRGQTIVGRACDTFANNLRLPELVTTTEAEFVARAVAIAADLDALSRLRQGLRTRMQASPLMDGPRFARNMEAAYRAAWRRYCSDAKRERIDLPIDEPAL